MTHVNEGQCRPKLALSPAAHLQLCVVQVGSFLPSFSQGEPQKRWVSVSATAAKSKAFARTILHVLAVEYVATEAALLPLSLTLCLID